MKKCYECGKELNNNEVVQGMKKYWDCVTEAEGEDFEFEGWVNCVGSADVFVGKEDKEIVEQFYNEYFMGRDDINPIGMVVACEDCVSMKYDERVNEITYMGLEDVIKDMKYKDIIGNWVKCGVLEDRFEYDEIEFLSSGIVETKEQAKELFDEMQHLRQIA